MRHLRLVRGESADYPSSRDPEHGFEAVAEEGSLAVFALVAAVVNAEGCVPGHAVSLREAQPGVWSASADRLVV